MSDEIRPFEIGIPQADLDYLQDRLANARWPGELPDVGWVRGVPLGYLMELAEYWRTGYDWRAPGGAAQPVPAVHHRDRRPADSLPACPVRAARREAAADHARLPELVAEFLQLIEPLVNPAEGQAFHVVAPSLPGYAFSTPLAATGWTMGRTARAWVELMRRLGYQRYGVHGGDIGAGVSGVVAGLDGEHVIGMHVVTDPLTAANTATFLPGMADRLDQNDPVDKLILDRMNVFQTDGSGYLAIQNTRPQTIGYGLVDSPLLQLAWIAEKVHEWTDLPVDRDQLLTTVSLYWFTGSGATAAHTLYEQAHSSDWGAPPAVPQGFAVFGADETVRKLVPAPADAHWTEFPRGKHFPAMEAPTQLAADLQAFFGRLQ